MASNSSGGAPGSSGNPPLPLYYQGIPKDLGKKREPAPRYTPKLDKFGMNLLNNINRKQKAAREKRIAEERARARAAEEASRQKEEEIRLEKEQAARALIAKSTNSQRSRGRSSFESLKNDKSRSVITKRRASAPARGRRRKSKKGDSDDDEPRIIPMKGMEIVTRKKKQVVNPKIRNTSDYSDLFGDDYLVGADVEATRALAKTSKAETERVRAAEEQRKMEREKARKRGEEFDRMKMQMERSGELKTKAGREKLRRLRDQFQSEDYESVSINNSTAVAKAPKTKKARQIAEAASIASKKAALKARLQKMVAEPEFAKFESKADGRRPASSASQRPRKRSRVYSDDEYDSYEDDEPRRRPAKKLKKKRPVYEDTDEDDESDSDRGGRFLTDFAELEEEEELSRRIGELEDKRELKAEAKRKREKAARRRAAGLDSDDD